MKRRSLFLLCFVLGVGFAGCSDSTGPGSLSDRWILFTGQAALEPGNPVIYAIRPDGTGLRKVTSGLGQALYPRWSRDGNQIAYVTIGSDQIYQVWVMKRDESSAHSIATGPNCYSALTKLSWSPSGDRVVADCYLTDEFVINVADKTSYSLAGRWGRVANDPDWSPSADKILYSSGSSTYVANLDGSGVSLFGSLAKNHLPQITLRQSIDMLSKGLRGMGFSDPDFRNSPYIRLKVLESHIAAGRLTSDLRWSALAPEDV